MTTENRTKHLGLTAGLYGGMAALTYMVMITVTLAHIEATSGHNPFDMRPFGYSPAAAAALLDGLGADGRAYYLTHQIPLDTLYPALLALTLITHIRWLGKGLQTPRLIRLGIACALATALCDYAENLGIAAMILSWPSPSAPLVYCASLATIAKSALTMLAVVLTFLIGILRAASSKPRRPTRPYRRPLGSAGWSPRQGRLPSRQSRPNHR